MEGVDPAFARTFGNYNLHGIEEVHLPEAVSWMPQTIGWKVLALLLLLLCCLVAYRQINAWWQNRYRREALKQLAELEAAGDTYTLMSCLPRLLKATALQCFPRQDIASLSGDDWLQFLSEHYPGPSFNDPLGKQLISIAYQNPQHWTAKQDDVNALVARVRCWIKKHRGLAPGQSLRGRMGQ